MKLDDTLDLARISIAYQSIFLSSILSRLASLLCIEAILVAAMLPYRLSDFLTVAWLPDFCKLPPTKVNKCFRFQSYVT